MAQPASSSAASGMSKSSRMIVLLADQTGEAGAPIPDLILL
jgi:hypothetical protein